MSETERWSKNGILDMKGTPWEPILGRYNQHIPVDIADNGGYMGHDIENENVTVDVVDDEAGNQKVWHDSRMCSMQCNQRKRRSTRTNWSS